MLDIFLCIILLHRFPALDSHFESKACRQEFSSVWFILCCCLVTKLCLTLCNPMDCSLLSFFVHGIFQARILGCYFLLQGIFQAQGSNQHLLH